MERQKGDKVRQGAERWHYLFKKEIDEKVKKRVFSGKG